MPDTRSIVTATPIVRPIPPSHRPIIAHSFTAWASTRGTSTVVSAVLPVYAHPASPSAVSTPTRTCRPPEVTFRLSPSYGLTTGHEANEWFIDMMYEYEEFEVETDKPGEWPVPFWSETVRSVVAT